MKGEFKIICGDMKQQLMC